MRSSFLAPASPSTAGMSGCRAAAAARRTTTCAAPPSPTAAAGSGRRASPALTLVVMAAAHGGESAARPAGARWGRLVSRIAAALPGVDVRGGLDVEVEWAPAAAVRDWLAGYLARDERERSSTSGRAPARRSPGCPAGWTLADLAAVASAGGRGVVVPQIYANAGGNATEWAALAALGDGAPSPAD